MKSEKYKLNPLLGPDFPQGRSSDGQPPDAARLNDLFSAWRGLPQFANWDDLTLASMLGDAERARRLLEGGAAVNGQPNLGTTPLIEALSHDHADVAFFLLTNGADASRRTPTGWTPLHLAASSGWTDILKVILSQNVDIDSITQEGWTPLTLGAMRRHADVVKLLLLQGADPEIRDAQGATALLYAAKGGQEESGGDYDCLSALIEHGANVNASDARGWTPLMGASFYGDLRSARLLIERGAQVNTRSKDGETARSLAERSKQSQIMDFLDLSGN